jgi:predicted CopG family antitoxin
MKTISICIEDEQANLLEKVASEDGGRSVSSVIRQLINVHLTEGLTESLFEKVANENGDISVSSVIRQLIKDKLSKEEDNND